MLTLQDINKYWPHNLIVSYEDGHGSAQKIPVTGIKRSSRDGKVILLNDKITPLYLHECQPLLRPLSQLVEEIEHEGKKFVPIVELAKMQDFYAITNRFSFTNHNNISASVACETFDYLSLDGNTVFYVRKLYNHQSLSFYARCHSAYQDQDIEV